MLEYILDKLFPHTIYIKFNSDYICFKSVDSGKIYEDKPLVAVGRKESKAFIDGVGFEVENKFKPDITIHNGFSHPRVCIGDFDIAEATLKHFMTKMVGKMQFIRPIIIMHPLTIFDDGLSHIEQKAIRELAYSAGARKVFIWSGRELKDKELASLSFPEDEGTLIV